MHRTPTAPALVPSFPLMLLLMPPVEPTEVSLLP